MTRNARLGLRLLAATLLAMTAAAISVGTALAGGGGPPLPH